MALDHVMYDRTGRELNDYMFLVGILQLSATGAVLLPIGSLYGMNYLLLALGLVILFCAVAHLYLGKDAYHVWQPQMVWLLAFLPIPGAIPFLYLWYAEEKFRYGDIRHRMVPEWLKKLTCAQNDGEIEVEALRMRTRHPDWFPKA